MEDLIIKQLEDLNFSKIEAGIYLTLVKNGPLNGSKISKLLNSSRSSVYSALNNLTEKSIIYPAPGNTNVFRAENPDTLFTRLQNSYSQTAETLKKDMVKLNNRVENRDFINIKGLESVISKSREILLTATKEVFINTCLDLQIFKDEFNYLDKKGVKIVVFTYSDLSVEGLPVTLYYNKTLGKESVEKNEIRLMIVCDLKTTLIASGTENEVEISGTFTENPLLSSIVSEHIHHDIYLMKLNEKYKTNIIDKNILIDSMLEKR